MSVRSIILMVLLSVACIAASEYAIDPRKAEPLARAILASSSNLDVDKRLREVDPKLPDRSWVLPVLFARVSTGPAADLYWKALCRVDTWGDGAWHLEMKGAAFDAFAKNPGAFVDRYLGGDDCALLLLTYAYTWPLEAPEVGGIDCKDGGKAELSRFERAIAAGREAAISASPPNTATAKERMGIILNLVATYDSAWSNGKGAVEKSCEESHE